MDNMNLVFVDDVTPTMYLRQMLALYPYDIEEALVFSLLQKDMEDHPSLRSFIEFMRHVQKYHLYWDKHASNDLSSLFETICLISQRNKMVLHTHQFQFHASLHLCHYRVSNPYGHIPFDKVAFIDRIYIHHAPILSMPTKHDQKPLQESHQFMYKNISINAFDYVALAIQMRDQHGILYIPKHQLGLVCACASLYQISKPNTHNHFMILCGVVSKQEVNQYYYDATHEMYIGLLSGNHRVHFEEIRTLLTTIYAQICLKKQDYLLQGAMVSLSFPHQEKGIVLCGRKKSGKSEILHALLRLCDQQGIPYQKLSDNHTTLHHLDHGIYATGCEIGACQHADAFAYVHLYQQLTSSVLLQVEERLTHLLVPFTTFEETQKFHKVDLCIYLDHEKKPCGYQSIDSLHRAKEVFHDLSLYDQTQDALSAFLEWMFLENVEVGMFTTHCTKRSKDIAYMRFAKQLLAYLQALALVFLVA